MADFTIAYNITAKIEGGYAHTPGDRGGETYNGIARNSNPRWVGWVTIDSYKNQPNFPANLSQAATLPTLVQSFYKANYWDVNHLDGFTDQKLANEMYDIGVNMGTGEAALFLQRALNVAGEMGKGWPLLTVDGGIGEATLNALLKAKPWEVLKLVAALQGAHYMDIVEKDPTQTKFIASWMSRWATFQ